MQHGTYHAGIEPASRPPAPEGARFPTFEGLRALCALGVLAYHAGTYTGLTWGGSTDPSAPGPWVQHLNVGVSIFFVLSGFLLFRPFVVAHLVGEPAPATGPYLWRRLVRIYPAWWVTLFVSDLLLDLQLGDGWGQLRYYALIQIYWEETAIGGLIQAWSLNTELSFYLFLPVWAWALRRARGSVEQRIRLHYVALAALFAVGIGFRAWLRASDAVVGYATLPANSELFAVGMALAVASAAAAVRGRAPGGLLRTLADAPGAAWLAALACYGAVVSLRYPQGFDAPGVGQEVVHQLLFAAIAGLVVAPGVFGPQDRGLVRGVLRWRPLVALGVVSYGVYLWHITVMNRLVRAGGPLEDPRWLALVVVGAAISTLVAAASWVLLERPLLVWVHRTRGRSRQGDRLASADDAPGAPARAGSRDLEERM